MLQSAIEEGQLLDTVPMNPDVPEFCILHKDGSVEYNMHPGQSRMIESRKRRVVFIGGTRVGKSSAGPVWLLDEIAAKGPGHYIVAAPTYGLLMKGAYQEMQGLYTHKLQLGKFVQNKTFTFQFNPDGEDFLYQGTQWENVPDRPPTVIWMMHASDPNALEALTAKAAWLDEAGQQEFKLESYEAVERRISMDKGRILITTTPYDLGWIYTRLFLPWKKNKDNGIDDPFIDIIQSKTIENPAFPVDEYWRQRNSGMPLWRFKMMYDAEFSIPAGLVYDCLAEKEGTVRLTRCALPQDSIRLLGVDFGGINTAGVYAAQLEEDWFHEPSGRIIPRGAAIIYNYYHPAEKRAILTHATQMQALEPWLERICGGARSEDQWRDEFDEAGMYIEKPRTADLMVGIAKVYGLIQRDLLFIFDDLLPLWEEFLSYRYEVDPETGEVIQPLKIIDQNRYHLLDSCRYLSNLIVEILDGMKVAVAGGESHEGGYFDELNGKKSEHTQAGLRVVKQPGRDEIEKLMSGFPDTISEALGGPRRGRIGGRRVKDARSEFGRQMPSDYEMLRRKGLLG